MKELREAPAPLLLSASKRDRLRWGTFGLAAAVLALCFGRPLFALMRFSLPSQLYSHIILVPLISLYIAWTKRDQLSAPAGPDRGVAILLWILGLAFLATFWALALRTSLTQESSLALTTLSFLFFFEGLCGWFLGRRSLRLMAFPLAFLFFMVPFPAWVTDSVETILQHCSAVAALGLFILAGTPVFFHDLILQLPDITLEVAPQCSGIHSSLALLVTSLVAGHFFLKSNWKRCALTAVVIPLAILRNGFRIFTIGELCVHMGPEMIDSYIHHKGGPIFFTLSLLPFLIFLAFLIRRDRPVRTQSPRPHA